MKGAIGMEREGLALSEEFQSRTKEIGPDLDMSPFVTAQCKKEVATDCTQLRLGCRNSCTLAN
jgi:hypothetical protein